MSKEREYKSEACYINAEGEDDFEWLFTAKSYDTRYSASGISGIFDCLIYGNSSSYPYNSAGLTVFGITEIVNCTIIGNSGSCGGVYVKAYSSHWSDADLKNCIIWNNTPNEI